MPFDRLVRWTDEWAGQNPHIAILAQIGEGSYSPKHMRAMIQLAPAEFDRHLQEADAVVAHAGTGTVLKALYLGKPTLVVPRLSRLGETRNDHQVGTAHHFCGQGLLQMAEDQVTFRRLLDGLPRFMPAARVSNEASPQLISAIRSYLELV